MTWTLAEGLADDVVDYLTTNLPARLDLIDAEIGDGITLADPVSWEIAEPSLASLNTFPVGVVLVGDTSLLQWTGVEITGEHAVTIAMLVLDPDSTVLRRRLYRYGRAIFEELADAHGDAGITADIGTGRIELGFSPVFASGDSQFLADVQVVVPMTKKETR